MLIFKGARERPPLETEMSSKSKPAEVPQSLTRIIHGLGDRAHCAQS